MNKLAIFVEGYTEVVFVEKLKDKVSPRHVHSCHHGDRGMVFG